MKVFDFADRYRGSYSSSLSSAVCPFYCSYSGYQEFLEKTTAEFQLYKSHSDNYICSLIPGTSSFQAQYTPGGLFYKASESNLQYVTSTTFLLLTYAKYLGSNGGVARCGGSTVTADLEISINQNSNQHANIEKKTWKKIKIESQSNSLFLWLLASSSSPSSLLFYSPSPSLRSISPRSDRTTVKLSLSTNSGSPTSADSNSTSRNIHLSNPNPDLDRSKIGFFLCTFDSWLHVTNQLEDGEITCALQSDLVKPVLTFKDLIKDQTSLSKTLTQNDADQYTLVFANCLTSLKVSMDVKSAMYNLDKGGKVRDYLSAGKTMLPRVYYLLSLIYFVLAGVWIYVLYKKRLTVYRIHFFMLAVVILKTMNLLCEAEDKSYIKRTGYAHGWDILFYIFSFLKGITLFTLIVLIGTGWSFLKPYLQGKEKKVLMIVIPLQVVANIAQVVIDENGPYEQDWVTWKQVFLLVDVVCCCAVLFPIVWSIKNLREAARTDGKAAVNLMKLTLFRQYYIVVICYIYFTRVVVYALETITSYKYLWTSVVAGELATLAFYVFTGYKFKPEAHNPYFVVDDEEEEAAAEALRLEDEFEL
ncbi:hypothetical protein OIU85_025826 [Salix viminalis]|uniref:cellulase n=1 Tax=Salix viminalis TaxID=40686 RepID=A0A9Q0TMF8_SALVM|nr:hypothetical protein OIU85_025826 [Salix viminalis]